MYNVLYVDDEPELLDMARHYLENTGEFKVGIQTTAQAALNSLQIRSCDAIISDYQMLDMDGIEFLKAVRDRFGDVPFILFTGRGREEVVIQAINNGADFYLQKGGDPSVQFAELAHKIKKAVERCHAMEALKDSEQRLSDIIDFLPDATFAIDRYGNVIAWNRAIEEMTGIPAAEMLGKGDHEYAIPFYDTRRPMLIDLIFAPDDLIAKDYSHIIHQKDILIADTNLSRPKGKSVTLMGKASPLYNRQGEIVGAIESIRDITEMRKAEEEIRAANEQLTASSEELKAQYDELTKSEQRIRESEAKFRELSELLPQIVFEMDRNFQITFVNRHAYAALGYTPAQVAAGFSALSVIAPSQHQRIAENIRKLALNEPYEHLEYTFIRKDGSTFPALVFADSIYKGGELTGFRGVIIDITERKRTEEALRESEEKYREIFENTTVAVFQTRTDGSITTANPAFARLLGYDSPEEVTREVPDIQTIYVYPDLRDELFRILRKHGAVENFELALCRRNGSVLWASVNVRAVYDSEGRVTGLEGLAVDITERKKAEVDLLESETRYRLLVNNTEFPVVVTGIESGNALFINESASRFFGVSAEEMTKQQAREFWVNHADRDRFASDLLSKGKLVNYETQLKTKAGEVRWTLINATVIDFAGERAAYIIYNDITDWKRAEGALRESQERFRRLISSSFDAVVVHQEGRIVLANDAAARIIGAASAGDVIGMPVPDFVHPDFRELVVERGRQMLQSPDVTVPLIEVKFVCFDGTAVDVEAMATVTQHEGRPAAMVVFRDISGRKKAEVELQSAYVQLTATEEELRGQYEELALRDEQLRESEEKFRALVETTSDFIWEVDAAGTYTYVSPQVRNLLGFEPEELIGKTPFDIMPPDEAKRVAAEFARLVESQLPVSTLENRCIHKSGAVVVLETSGVVRIGKDGSYQGYRGIDRDITRRKLAEDALRESETRFRQLITLAPIPFGFVNKGGIIEYVNDRFTQVFGYTHDDVPTLKEWWQLAYPDENYRRLVVDTWETSVKKASEKRIDIEPVEYNVTCKNGAVRNVIIGGITIEDNLLATFTDVTERRRAEEALRKSEERFRSLVQHSYDCITILGADGKIIYESDSLYPLFGHHPNDMIGLNPFDFVHPEDRARAKETFLYLFEHPEVVFQIEYRFRHADGSWVYVESVGTNRLSDPAIHGIVLNSRVITERKETENALRQSEEKFRALVETTSDFIWEVDAAGTYTYVSPQVRNLLGFEPEELIGKTPFDIISPDEAKRVAAEFTRLVESQLPISSLEKRCIHKNGSVVVLETSGVLRVAEDGSFKGYRGIDRDITDRKNAEETLSRLSRQDQEALRIARMGHFEFDVATQTFLFNDQYYAMIGITADQAGGYRMTAEEFAKRFVPPDYAHVVGETIREAIETTDPNFQKQFESRIIQPDGTVMWVMVWFRIEKDAAGRTIRFYGVNQDITEQKEAAIALRESEQRFQQALDAANDGLFDWDMEKEVAYFSPRYFSMLGYRPDELPASFETWGDLLHPDDRDRAFSVIHEYKEGKRDSHEITFRLRAKDGSWKCILSRAKITGRDSNGQPVRMVGTHTDITDRHQSEVFMARISTLKQDLLGTGGLEEKLKRITDTIVDLFGADFARIWISGPGDLCENGCIHGPVTEGPHACRNRATCLHLVVSSGRYTHTDGGHRRVPFGAYKIGRIASGEDTFFVTNDVTHDPRVHDPAWAASLGLVSFAGFRLVSAEGSPIGVIALFSRQQIPPDILGFFKDLATTSSQVVRTGLVEQALRESEQHYRSVIDNIEDAFLRTDPEGRLVMVSPSAVEMMGYASVEEMIGIPIVSLYRFSMAREELLEQMKEYGNVHDYEVEFKKKDGSVFWGMTSAHFLYDGNGKITGTEGIIRDITERRKMENAVREASRKLNLLNSITRHDVVNQLTALQGYIQIVAMKKPDPVTADFLVKIDTAAEKIARQIEFTRTYQELGIKVPAWFKIGEVVSKAGTFPVRFSGTCKATEIFADPMLEQVFFNLFDNAVRHGEQVTGIVVRCEREPDGLLVIVEDNGIGIPLPEKEKIFLRGYGKHTGLGLFLVREILAITGITIKETGEHGKGARFEIFVPKGAYRFGSG